MSDLNAAKLPSEMDRMSPEGDLASTNLYVFIPTSVRQLSVISMAVQYPKSLPDRMTQGYKLLYTKLLQEGYSNAAYHIKSSY